MTPDTTSVAALLTAFVSLNAMLPAQTAPQITTSTRALTPIVATAYAGGGWVTDAHLGPNASSFAVHASSYPNPYLSDPINLASAHMGANGTLDPFRRRYELHHWGSVHIPPPCWECGWSFNRGSAWLGSYAPSPWSSNRGTPFRIAVDFSTTIPVAGAFVVEVAESRSQYWTQRAIVRLNGDSIDYDSLRDGSETFSFPRILAPGTSTVFIEVVADIRGPSGWGSMDLAVSFVPDSPCQTTDFGTGCGLDLAAIGTNTGIDYRATGLEPGGLGLWVIGFRQVTPVALPFPPGCEQLVAADLHQILTADGNGAVYGSLGLTSLPSPMALFMQFAGLAANGDVLGSNGVRVGYP